MSVLDGNATQTDESKLCHMVVLKVKSNLKCHSRENGNPKLIKQNGFPLSPKGMPMAVRMTGTLIKPI